MRKLMHTSLRDGVHEGLGANECEFFSWLQVDAIHPNFLGQVGTYGVLCVWAVLCRGT